MGESERFDSNVRFGVFEIDLRSGELRKAGTRIRLQDQPFKVLTALLECPGEVVTREELRRRIWPNDSFGDFDHAVNVAVAKLRTALGDSADVPRFIETLHRRGYRFIYPVSSPSGAESCVASIPSAIASGQLPSAVEPVALVRPGPVALRRWKLLSVTIAVSIAAAAALWVYHRTAGRFSQNLSPPDLQIAKATNSGNIVHMDISPDGRFLVYALRSNKGTSLWVRQVGTTSDLEILRPAFGTLRGITFTPDGNYILFARSNKDDLFDRNLYRMPVFGGAPQLLVRNVDSRASFSPDGRQIMFVRKDVKHNTAEVRLTDADGGGERLLATFAEAGSEWQGGGSWSPDGRMVAVSIGHWGKQAGWELDTIAIADSSVRSLYSSQDGIGPPVWLNDGNAILVVLDDKAEHGRIWTISYPQGQAHPVTHDLENYDSSLQITRDAKTIAAVSVTETANVYVAQAPDLGRMQQITFGDQFIEDVAPGPNGRLLIHSEENADGELWTMNNDGSQTALFTKLRNVSFPSRCGSFVLFVARDKDTDELMRVDADGLNPKQLASGKVWSPCCSPDGGFIYYADLSSRPQRILRISIEGGLPTEIAKVLGKWMVGTVTVSADGKLLAYPFQHDQSEFSSTQPSYSLVVIPAEGGSPIRTFPNVLGEVQWAPGGGGLDYYDRREGVIQIVEQPLAGGPPRQLTKFGSGQSASFHWSLDGKQLYLTHGEVKSNVVLITNFR